MSKLVFAIASAAVFIGSVVGANWALERWGVVNVGFGLEAPAGAWFAGVALVARDALHETAGARAVPPAIAGGAVLSWWIADGVSIPGGVVSIAAASGLAFAFSESCDWAVYTPLRRRNAYAAVALSNTVGAVADSVLFLWLAFGTLDNTFGQVWAKSLVTIPALVVIGVRRSR